MLSFDQISQEHLYHASCDVQFRVEPVESYSAIMEGKSSQIDVLIAFMFVVTQRNSQIMHSDSSFPSSCGIKQRTLDINMSRISPLIILRISRFERVILLNFISNNLILVHRRPNNEVFSFLLNRHISHRTDFSPPIRDPHSENRFPGHLTCQNVVQLVLEFESVLVLLEIGVVEKLAVRRSCEFLEGYQVLELVPGVGEDEKVD